MLEIIAVYADTWRQLGFFLQFIYKIKRNMNILKLSLTSILIVFGASFASAQNVAIADLQQDMALLKREVGQLRLEVEQLRRENSELASRIKSVQGSTVGNDVVRAQVSSVKSEVSAQNDALKREIISQVKKDMEAMAAQTNAAMEKLAKAISVKPQAPLQPAFSNDFPQNGFTYTVKSGDSLSKIARSNKSKVKWIQDANKIADPSRGLRVGDQIFIPQE